MNKLKHLKTLTFEGKHKWDNYLYEAIKILF
jgi:hypothetical protein